ncbi:unnamed protein product [Cylindrotheca closterium]|uniref:Uncharacterized protein n=1 Tax=Cylindrotheca closterium TaxID=2856 RepID=A0AAD2CIA4_9STRA|nr:unnamed protein product [Cylindrotheca closterium]
MDQAPRRPSRRSMPKAVCFNPDVRVRIVKPLHYRAKRSDLWVSREDLKQKRAEFHGILDCLTLDSSFYEEGGYFLLGLDSKKDQELKYRNVVDSRYAVLKEQRHQTASSRWHCGVGSSTMSDCISESYQEHTQEASNVARFTAVRLEEELNAEEKQTESEIMSLREVKTLLKRSSSHRTNSLSVSSRSNSFHDFMDIWIKEVDEAGDDSSGDDWSVGSFSSDDDDDIFGNSMEIPIRETDRSNLKRYAFPKQDQVDDTQSTADSSVWSVDISTDNDDDFLAQAPSVESPRNGKSFLAKEHTPQGSDIFVPTFSQPLPKQAPSPKNAIAA